ncbi:hypothetical protein C1X77_27555, partial [Pseudomonas sp. GW531-E2]|uniref:ATP-binding protein n=1 Tax=Pseudomonas sp. GW531-E2 TaxID=2070679 RepID=UPI000CAF3867
FHPAELDCIAILREVCQQQRELTPRAQIIETYPDNALPAWGDAKLLHQAFANLVSNAVKYSPEGSEITVSAVRASDTVIV